MGNVLVDEAKAALAEIGSKPECPQCGSKVLVGVWVRVFKLHLAEENSEELLGSGMCIARLYCPGCAWKEDF